MAGTGTERSEPTRVDRRALLKAGAWSVPVLTLAVATPAQAASDGVRPVIGYDQFTTFTTGAGGGEFDLIVGLRHAGPFDAPDIGPTWTVAVSIDLGPLPDGDQTPEFVGDAAGWSYVPPSTVAGGTRTFVFTTEQTVAPFQAPTTFSVRFALVVPVPFPFTVYGLTTAPPANPAPVVPPHVVES